MIKDSTEQITIKRSQYLRMQAEIVNLKQAHASCNDVNAILTKENEKLINIHEEFNQLQSKLKYLSLKSLSLAHFRIKEQASQNIVTLSTEAYQQLRLRERSLQDRIVQLQSSVNTKRGQIQRLIAFKTQNEAQIARLRRLVEETDEKHRRARREKDQCLSQNLQLRQKYNQSMQEINRLMISNLP